jgi:hypothetical protein
MDESEKSREITIQITWTPSNDPAERARIGALLRSLELSLAPEVRIEKFVSRETGRTSVRYTTKSADRIAETGMDSMPGSGRKIKGDRFTSSGV